VRRLKIFFSLLSLLILAAVIIAGIKLSNIMAHSKEHLTAMPELHQDYPDLGKFGASDVLMVFAHPDDELEVVGQYAALYTQLHSEDKTRHFRWIIVSDAGKGKVLPLTCLGKTKTECRLEEADQVASCLGVPAPERMNLPDGGLRKVPDLAQQIQQKLSSGGTEKIAAIFSSDEAGLYGHPDHLAVHDAMLDIARQFHSQYISGALPSVMKTTIPLREPALSENRHRPDINAKFDLDEQAQKQMACAARSYRSQALLIWGFMQFLPPLNFYEAVPRLFLNLSKP
jgi:LmbE family N-acetylglucosaminyl deacetylase